MVGEVFFLSLTIFQVLQPEVTSSFKGTVMMSINGTYHPCHLIYRKNISKRKVILHYKFYLVCTHCNM